MAWVIVIGVVLTAITFFLAALVWAARIAIVVLPLMKMAGVAAIQPYSYWLLIGGPLAVMIVAAVLLVGINLAIVVFNEG